ncbi:aldehyde dehydrogenase [Pseudomonas putida S11]|nr:aldehyde dehydrogenase [Pseudomonas putida S11]
MRRVEVLWSAELTRYAASLAWNIQGEAYSHLGDNKLGLVTHEARGVVGLIVPWNFPMVCLFQKLPYALAAGCPVVIKPSELTSGTALEVAKLAAEAGFPAGLINVVTGTGAQVGDRLTRHPDVSMISFTGSTRVGKQIAATAASDLTRVALELGGKAANVVFADADLDAALDGVLFGVILNQGEECVAGTRLLIEESVAEEFVAKLIERSKRVVVGLPLDAETQVGALIHAQHMESVLNYIEIGKQEGARLVYGGDRLTANGLDKGYFVGPTIFTEVKPEHRIFREEIFGPVLTVTTFKTVEEAITLANDTEYGLGNGLWTKDVDKAIKVSQKLQSGTVFVNTYLETSPQLPFGGFKKSGYGRENGVDGLREFMETKSTFIKMGERAPVLPNTVG